MGKAMRAKVRIRPPSTAPALPDGMVTLPADVHTMDFLRHHLDFNATWSAPIDGNALYANLSALLNMPIFNVRKRFWHYCDAAKKTHKLGGHPRASTSWKDKLEEVKARIFPNGVIPESYVPEMTAGREFAPLPSDLGLLDDAIGQHLCVYDGRKAAWARTYAPVMATPCLEKTPLAAIYNVDDQHYICSALKDEIVEHGPLTPMALSCWGEREDHYFLSTRLHAQIHKKWTFWVVDRETEETACGCYSPEEDIQSMFPGPSFVPFPAAYLYSYSHS